MQYKYAKAPKGSSTAKDMDVTAKEEGHSAIGVIATLAPQTILPPLLDEHISDTGRVQQSLNSMSKALTTNNQFS